MDVKSELAVLYSRPVTPETIATYEEDSLRQLSTVVQHVVSLELGESGSHEVNSVVEDEAFAVQKLPVVGEVLEVLQGRINRVREAGACIAERTLQVDEVITPPDEIPMLTHNGLQSSHDSETSPILKQRLQTLLYIVQELDVDLDEVLIYAGPITHEMYRETTYHTVVIPSLDRVVQLCDEVNNSTFIFSLSNLEDGGTTIERLRTMTKEELKNLIRQTGHGDRLKYTNKWHERIRELLISPDLKPRSTELSMQPANETAIAIAPRSTEWTDPETSKRYTAQQAIYKELGISWKKIIEHAAKSKTKIEARSFLVGKQEAVWYAIDDIRAIESIAEILALPQVEQEGDWANFYVHPETGEHYGSKTTIKNRLNIAGITLDRFIEQAGLKPVEIRGTTRSKLPAYSFEALMADKEFKRWHTTPAAETKGKWQGYYTSKDGSHIGSVPQLSVSLGVSPHTIMQAVSEHKLDAREFRNGGRVWPGYCYEKVAVLPLITEKLAATVVESEGEWANYAIDPDDDKHWAHLKTLAKKLGCTPDFLESLVEDLPAKSLIAHNGTVRVGGVFTGYALEDIGPRYKATDLGKAQPVTQDGEWKGFYVHPDSGEHFANLGTLVRHTGHSAAYLNKFLAILPVVIKLHSMASDRAERNTARNGYSLEALQKLMTAYDMSKK